MSVAVVVLHGGYGCETGCCGHRIIKIDPAPVEWPDDKWKIEYLDGAENVDGYFTFDHPWAANTSFREWAEKLIADEMGPEHVKDLAWDHCLVVDD